MARLTDAERTRICALYKQRRKALSSAGDDESRWRTFEYVAGHVKRDPQVIRDTLIAKGVISPTPPRDVDETEMGAIATDYLQGMSIRECIDSYDRPYGTIRRILIYKRVQLRGRGGRRPVRS